MGIAATIVAGSGSADTSGDAVGLAVTFGDTGSSAPASYDTDAGGSDPPTHIAGDLALGSATSQAGAGSWPALTTAMIGQSHAVTVPISGASRAGELCGYIDFDHTGRFADEPAKRACTSFAAGAGSATLTWTVPPDTTAGPTWVRLRAAYDGAQVESPTGPAASGEIEDFAASISPTVTVESTLPNGTAGSFDLSAGGTIEAPGRPIAVSSDDIANSRLNLTVSEAPSAGNAYRYATAVTCVDGTGRTVATGSAMAQSISIPASGEANGLSQNVTCTFGNTGIAGLQASTTASPTSVSAHRHADRRVGRGDQHRPGAARLAGGRRQ